MKRKTLIVLLLPAFLLISFRASRKVTEQPIGVNATLDYYVSQITALTTSAGTLHEAVQKLNTDTASVINARNKLAACRISFKKIEFFTEYFFKSETRWYNAAPVFEVEEPTLELVEPMGLQQMESLLYEGDVLKNKATLLMHTEALYSSVKDLKTLLYQFEVTDAQILESLRIELIRVMALSISGYDAPVLKTGIRETQTALESMQHILQPYMKKNTERGASLQLLLQNAIEFMAASSDFDNFDRMTFLKRFGLPLQSELGGFIKALNLELNTTKHLNYAAKHLFDPTAINQIGLGYGPDSSRTVLQQQLGKMLFAENSLSGKQNTSCATCHQPGNYFNDNLVKSPSLHSDSILKRNTPTLLYAGRQHMQFWDGRSATLEDQIKNVIFNPLEMDGHTETITARITGDKKYRSLLEKVFPDKKAKDIDIDEMATCIAAYVNTLAPMNSAFDRYINGDEKALSATQIDGFNLFMGKAQCGTCHFIPYFNSLLPPLFDISEVEVLGTTANDDPEKPEKDADRGRYDLFHIRYYNGAFKTPTVRNATKTAPYMHNGSFKTLNSVMEFYNRGGGAGLGLDIEDQTLSPKPLNLTHTEIDHIITFIDSLTDSFAY